MAHVSKAYEEVKFQKAAKKADLIYPFCFKGTKEMDEAVRNAAYKNNEDVSDLLRRIVKNWMYNEQTETGRQRRIDEQQRKIEEAEKIIFNARSEISRLETQESEEIRAEVMSQPETPVEPEPVADDRIYKIDDPEIQSYIESIVRTTLECRADYKNYRKEYEATPEERADEILRSYNYKVDATPEQIATIIKQRLDEREKTKTV